MSRRSRRRDGGGEKRWRGRAAVALLVVCVVVLGGGYAAVRSYLHSDKFRKFLSAEASKTAGVTGEFSPFRWDGLAVDTDRFEATGDGLVTSVRADDLHTEIGLGGVNRGVWEIRGSSVGRLDISVDARKKVDKEAIAKEERKSEKSTSRAGWLPSDAELQGMEIRDVTLRATLDQGLVDASGMSVHVEQSDGKKAYRAEVEGGTLRLPFGIVPEMRVERIRASYQDGQVFITEAKVGAWENGRIDATGEWDGAARRFFLEGDVTGIKCDDLLGADWAKRLTGDVVSGFAINNLQGFPVVKGKLTLTNGTLTALPMLDALAAYADTRRFRVLTLNEAHTEWKWQKDEISLTNLVLSSEGLVRVEGDMVIRGREMDGRFRLGLAPGTLSTIPGAETDVFLPGERGLLWTPVRITGTFDDPKEDLTERLIAAAGMRMFDKLPATGEEVIKFTNSVLGESPSKTVEKGVKIIEEGSKTVREVSGLLDGILGNGKKEEPEKKDK